MVELAFRDFDVEYSESEPHEYSVLVSLYSVTMQDLTLSPDSKHRMLMLSHTPQPPRPLFLSKSCPDFVSELPSPLCVASRDRGSLPGRLHAAHLTARPGSPDRVDDDEAPEDRDDDRPADDSLVRVEVRARCRHHPLYSALAHFTKVDFNRLSLTVSVESWVAVLDFFGVAEGDDGDEGRPAPATTARPPPAGPSSLEARVRSLSALLVVSGREVCRARASRLLVRGAASSPDGLRGRLGALQLSDLTQRAPYWRERLVTTGRRALTFTYRRPPGPHTEFTSHLELETAGLRYVHTRRFVSELQAFSRDFSLLRRVISEARRKVRKV